MTDTCCDSCWIVTRPLELRPVWFGEPPARQQYCHACVQAAALRPGWGIIVRPNDEHRRATH